MASERVNAMIPFVNPDPYTNLSMGALAPFIPTKEKRLNALAQEIAPQFQTDKGFDMGGFRNALAASLVKGGMAPEGMGLAAPTKQGEVLGSPQIWKNLKTNKHEWWYFDQMGRPASYLRDATKDELSGSKDGTGTAFNQGDKLRSQFLSLNKPFQEIRDAYSRVQAAAEKPSAAGDLALIFNYMKILDPGSVVREGEFATAQNAAGIPDRVRAMYNRVVSGERLAEDVRTDFVDRAGMLYQSQSSQYKRSLGEYKRLARESGLSESIFPDLGLAERPQRKQGKDGKWYVNDGQGWRPE